MVHSGTAQSGHYYTFVNTGSQWTEFNDSHVAPFDVSEMEAECFGGYEEVTTDSYGRRSQPRERTRNAFLLSYERRSDKDEDSWASPAPPAAVDERIARENVSLRRARAAFDAVTEAVEEHAGVRMHLGKLRPWCRAGGAAPPGLASLGGGVMANTRIAFPDFFHARAPLAL